MPITLAQAQLNAQAAIDYAVIDNFRRYSQILDMMVWDDIAVPGTGEPTLSYTYTRLTAAAAAAPRAFNTEYVPGQATRAQYTVNLKPLGGSFNIDRALARLGPQRSNEVSFQLQQLLTATRIRAVREMIYGDSSADPNTWDGLSKVLTGTSTEVDGTSYTSWAPSTLDTQAEAMLALDLVDLWLAKIIPSTIGGGDLGAPGALPAGSRAIISNTVGITRLRALARWAGLYMATKDDLGRDIESYKGWRLLDAGDREDGSSPIVPITSNKVDFFAVSFGIDSFHGISPAGMPLVQTWLPDFDRAGAVKTGEVEMGPVATVLKSTKAAGVLRSVTVQ